LPDLGTVDGTSMKYTHNRYIFVGSMNERHTRIWLEQQLRILRIWLVFLDD
jgi:hypothetical protein